MKRQAAQIWHVPTNYHELLFGSDDRQAPGAEVSGRVNAVLRAWEAASTE